TKQMEYDPQKDFTPIAFVASNSCLLTINAEVPANSVNEFVDYAKANPDMLGGRVHMYWPTPATVLPLIREGKIKALAISSPQRSSDLPQVPTMKELGIEELSLEYWAGVWAPAGTPTDIVEKLNAAVNKALQSPDLIASLKKLGFETRIGSPRDFAAFITTEIPRWAAVVKASGVKSQ